MKLKFLLAVALMIAAPEALAQSDPIQSLAKSNLYDYVCTKITYADGNVLVRVADSCFVVNPKTNQVSQLADLPRMPKQALYPAIIAAGDKYGYINKQGKVVIEGQWDYASDFRDGLARVVDGIGDATPPLAYSSAGKTGFIDTLGRYVIPIGYSYIDNFPSEFPVTRFTRGRYVCTDHMGCENPYKGSKWGLIDRNGKIIVSDDKYDFIDRGTTDQKSGKTVFGVVLGDKMGLIDAHGAEIFPMSVYASLQQMWADYLNSDTK